MAQSPKKLASKTKQPSSKEMRQSIDGQVAAFLKSGGEIQHIPNGVSGNTYGPSRHITLGKKPAPAGPDTAQEGPGNKN